MKKRALSLALALVLALAVLPGSASAAGFTKTQTYDGRFTDVPAGAWWYAPVVTCYEYGLMGGASDTSFNTNGMFTVYEALTIAARMHNRYNGGDGTFPAANPWYMAGVNYCLQNGIITSGQFDSYTRNITRAEMAGVLVKTLPDSQWTAINNVTQLPDVSASTDYSTAIFKMYNAGVVTGSGNYGYYYPYAYISRAEVATITARCVDPSLRQKLNLTPVSQLSVPAIPGFLNYYDYKMSSGLMRYRDSDSKLYGYINGTGAVAIAAEYKNANDFDAYGYAVVQTNTGYALINTSNTQLTSATYYTIYSLGYGGYAARMSSGQYCLIVNGARRSDHIYTGVYTNGIYFICKISDVSCDIYDINGNKTGHLDSVPSYKNGSPLLALRSGNKWALANGQGTMITAYLYDGIDLYDNSTLAVLKYGTQYALAGENGVIIPLGQCTYNAVNGDYASVRNDNGFAIADASGICSEYANYNFRYLSIKNGLVLGYDSWSTVGYSLELVYDSNLAQSYTSFAQNNYDDGYVMLQNGTYILYDGTYCNDVVSRGYNYATFRVNGLYGLAYKGTTVLEPSCASSDEAVAAYGYLTIGKDEASGKPVVVYGNPIRGWDYVIRYYQNSFNFDEIREVGEGYYACKYNTSWYLLHA